MMVLVVIIAVSMVLATGLLIRFAKLPPWGHRDMLAYVAMMATILGLLILVLFVDRFQEVFVAQADRLITELVRDPKVKDSVGDVLISIIDAMAFNMKFALIGVVVGLLSLGLVISARSLKASGLGANIELTTGEDGKPAIPVVVQQPPAQPVPTKPESQMPPGAVYPPGTPGGEIDAAPR
jgi:hypothetical protein